MLAIKIHIIILEVFLSSLEYFNIYIKYQVGSKVFFLTLSMKCRIFETEKGQIGDIKPNKFIIELL